MLANLESEQEVIVQFRYNRPDRAPLIQLEERLMEAVEAAYVDAYERNKATVRGIDNRLSIVGPDAEKIFAVVQPILATTPFLGNAQATIRYGANNDELAEQRVVSIATHGASH